MIVVLLTLSFILQMLSLLPAFNGVVFVVQQCLQVISDLRFVI